MATYRDRPLSFRDALRVAREILGASHELVRKGSIETEAEQLVIAAYRMASGENLSRLEFFSRIQDRFPEDAGERLLILAGSRAEGIPLQHLTGFQVFLDHEYAVGPDVLIPRPETEVLVARALDDLRGARPSASLGLEIGTGSGAISIELLAALPDLRMISSELTDAAAIRAEFNARKILVHDASRFSLVRALTPLEVWEPFGRSSIQQRADFLISNPPYLGAHDQIEQEVRAYEPETALFAPPGDLIYFYAKIACGAAPYLKVGARVYLELAHERGDLIRETFQKEGWRDIAVLPDLTGRARVLVATWPGKG